jgi:Protein of unknown function (DUF1236)
MRKSLLSIVTASALLAGVGVASAQMAATTTTTTENWTADQGPAIQQYSTTQKYKSFSDPAMRPGIGMELPTAVTLYPLPETMNVPSAERYRYGIINDHPVVVESSTRKVLHTWE